MRRLVVYKSKTGFSKKYAEMIAREIQCEVINFKDIDIEKISAYEQIIFGGGLYAGGVNGLKKVKELYKKSTAKELIVFATGATPNEAAKELDEMWRNNFTQEELDQIPHFYMQAGLNYENMSLPDRTLMKMFASMLGKKEKSEFEEGMSAAIKSSYDISDKKFIEPLMEYLRK